MVLLALHTIKRSFGRWRNIRPIRRNRLADKRRYVGPGIGEIGGASNGVGYANRRIADAEVHHAIGKTQAGDHSWNGHGGGVEPNIVKVHFNARGAIQVHQSNTERLTGKRMA